MTFTNFDGLLRNLPPPEAPATLLPRVMAAVRALSARPWYERSWFTWPPVWRLTSAGGALAAFALLVGVAPEMARMLGAPFAPVFTEWSGALTAIGTDASAGLTGVRVIWRTLVAPIAPYAFAVTAVMAAACALFAAALSHVATLEDLTR
jgi:hypothetical protein